MTGGCLALNSEIKCTNSVINTCICFLWNIMLLFVRISFSVYICSVTGCPVIKKA